MGMYQNRLRRVLSEVRVYSLLTGLLSFLPYLAKYSSNLKNVLGLAKPRRPLDFGFRVLKSRLEEALPLDIDINQKVVLEIGPGDNFSGPISAVLLGAKRGIGIDAYDYTDLSKNEKILELLQGEIGISDERFKEVSRELKAFNTDN